MASPFSGFSENDIQNIKSSLTPNSLSVEDTITKRFVRPVRNQIIPQRKYKPLSRSNTRPNTPQTPKTETDSQTPKESELALVTFQKEVHDKESNTGCELNGKEIEVKRPLDVEVFRRQQQIIEEQNKRRKELLTKTLAFKTKQTQDEVQKLNEIQNEFRKLDTMLTNDVNILRQQIDSASVEYMDARKRYTRVEQEYMEAKLTLQLKLERKELLTEHLCAIIQKNEERKAQKLNELIEKLDLNPVDAFAEQTSIDN